MKEKKTPMGLEVALLISLVLLLPTVAAQDPPGENDDSCLAYAYTKSENHLFLLGENVSIFGERLNVIHDCENLEVYVDGFFEVSSASSMSVIIEQGIHNITLQANGFNKTYQNVVFYPDRLNWEYEFRSIEDSKPQFIDLEVSELRTNWAVGVGIIIVWVLSTYVYWQIISSYVDRNFIEEVVQ